MIATEPTRTRRPQLTDTIAHLNDVIEGLSTAVPQVVADTLKEVLGADFAAAVGRAVAAGLGPVVRDAVRAEVAAARAELPQMPQGVTPNPTPANVKPPVPSKPSLTARVRTAVRRAKAWAVRRLDALLSVAAVGWAMLRLVAAAVAHSPVAVASAVVTAVAVGVVAAVTDPAVGVALAGLAAGTLTAVGVAAAPLVRAALDLDPDGGRGFG